MELSTGHAFSFAFMGASVAALFIAIIVTMPSRNSLLAALATGLTFAVANQLLESFGAALDVYHIDGPWPLYDSPASLNIAWLSWGALYGLLMRVLAAKGRGRRAFATLLACFACAGMVYDLQAEHLTGVLTWGRYGGIWLLPLVWFTGFAWVTWCYDALYRRFADIDWATLAR